MVGLALLQNFFRHTPGARGGARLAGAGGNALDPADVAGPVPVGSRQTLAGLHQNILFSGY
jgi:hypothetical protein